MSVHSDSCFSNCGGQCSCDAYALTWEPPSALVTLRDRIDQLQRENRELLQANLEYKKLADEYFMQERVAEKQALIRENRSEETRRVAHGGDRR